MTRRQIFVLIILLLQTVISVGQSIDIESEKFPMTKKLIVKSFNGCCAQKGFKAIYYFDSIGRAIKSSHYFKRQLRASYQYRYNDKGLLSAKILVYDINNKLRKDTTKFTYLFDELGRTISKTKYFGKWTSEERYSDFDTLNNAQTVLHIFDNRTVIEKRQFNLEGQQILNQRIKDDTITYQQEIKYNQFGDQTCSNIPTLLDKETGKMVRLIGGSRHSIVEYYDYTYDIRNRWTEKYVLFDNKKVLLEKRIFK